MRDVITEALAFAPVITFSPLPIVAIMLLLGSPRAHHNAPAFLAGWVLALSAIGVVVLAVHGGSGEEESPGVAVFELVLGVVAIALAGVQWHRRPRPGRPREVPGWIRQIDGFGPRAAFVTAIVLSAGNPKNLVPAIGGSAEIARAGLSTGQELVALAIFVLVGSLGVGLPVVLAFALRARSARLLGAFRAWLIRRSAIVVTVLLALIGAKLVADGLAHL
jgi:hypothetical protein